MTDATPVDSTESSFQPTSPPTKRRGLLTKAAAVLVGATVGVVPMLAATVTFLDPLLRRKKKATAGTTQTGTTIKGNDEFIKVTPVSTLAADGSPRMFPVIDDLQDAWNKFPNTEIGSVYLWQTSEGVVECFNARCPHLGCTVNYKAGESAYLCPCHDSAFSLDGERSNDIPPRNMDPLEAEVRSDFVWVKFQKFRAGVHDREVV